VRLLKWWTVRGLIASLAVLAGVVMLVEARAADFITQRFNPQSYDYRALIVLYGSEKNRPAAMVEAIHLVHDSIPGPKGTWTREQRGNCDIWDHHPPPRQAE
jgi:hypothetical protein